MSSQLIFFRLVVHFGADNMLVGVDISWSLGPVDILCTDLTKLEE